MMNCRSSPSGQSTHTRIPALHAASLLPQRMRLLIFLSRSLFASCALLHFSKQKVDHHINVLHSYNEIKDVVQSLMGQGRSSAAQEWQADASSCRSLRRLGCASSRAGLLNGYVSVFFSLLTSLQASALSSRANESRRCTKNLDWNWTTESTRAHQHAHRLPLHGASNIPRHALRLTRPSLPPSPPLLRAYRCHRFLRDRLKTCFVSRARSPLVAPHRAPVLKRLLFFSART